MKFGDYSPPSLPSLVQQRDALRKGLGRTAHWARSGRLGEELLLEACLRDQRFDTQVEDCRGDWLWEMVRAVGAVTRFRVPILHALYDLSDERSAVQHCEFARCYAEAGDEMFRDRLYDIVEQRPFDQSPWLGESELVALDGERGFLFAARIRGQQLGSREWDWDDRSFVRVAVKRFGETRVSELLDSSRDPAVGRLAAGWRHDVHERTAKDPRAAHKARMLAISFQEALRSAEENRLCFSLRGWGMYADEARLRVVLDRLWKEQQPHVIANLLMVFSARALPEFDARMVDLCRHGDEEVRRRAIMALAQNTHPLVREFALSELSKPVDDRSAVALLVKNYQKGDEHRLLEAIELPEDECHLHWLLTDVIRLLESNPEADASRLGVVCYASTPCQSCRCDAAKLLLDQRVAPDWLVQECKLDCEEDCRALSVSPTGSTKGSY